MNLYQIHELYLWGVIPANEIPLRIRDSEQWKVLCSAQNETNYRFDSNEQTQPVNSEANLVSLAEGFIEYLGANPDEISIYSRLELLVFFKAVSPDLEITYSESGTIEVDSSPDGLQDISKPYFEELVAQHQLEDADGIKKLIGAQLALRGYRIDSTSGNLVTRNGTERIHQLYTSDLVGNYSEIDTRTLLQSELTVYQRPRWPTPLLDKLIYLTQDFLPPLGKLLVENPPYFYIAALLGSTLYVSPANMPSVETKVDNSFIRRSLSKYSLPLASRLDKSRAKFSHISEPQNLAPMPESYGQIFAACRLSDYLHSRKRVQYKNLTSLDGKRVNPNPSHQSQTL